MKILFSFILLSLITLSAWAQSTVTGSVKDAVTGEPLVGVGVIVSTGGGAVTDMDGNYSVRVGKDATLTFNLLGYADVVEPVNGRNKIEVFMKEDVHFLDEVVVMGYTTQKKNELSSSVVSLRSEELLDNSTPDLGNMIQGKAAGVVVMNASGMPGEAAQIRIRGTGSISASADPLYVVDGIAGGTFNPNDVESVTILKDASATALYGASAAGGVIVVTFIPMFPLPRRSSGAWTSPTATSPTCRPRATWPACTIPRTEPSSPVGANSMWPIRSWT